MLLQGSAASSAQPTPPAPCIAINLIAGRYFDIAVRDLAMALSAVSFARLTAVVPQSASLRRRHVEAASAAT